MKSHAHDIVERVELLPEFRGEGKCNLKFVRGPVQCQIIKFPAGYKIPEHRHTGSLTWKYLLKGRIRYDPEHPDGGQVFDNGSISTVRGSAGTYSGIVEEDSYLLLVEKLDSHIVRAGAELDDFAILRGLLRRPFSAGWQAAVHLWRYGRAALFLVVYALVFLIGMYFWWPEVELRTLGVSLVTSTAFAFTQALALGLYRSRPARRFEGGFRLDQFCEDLKRMKREAVIYSTYSNLFVEDEDWSLFKAAIMELAERNDGHDRRIKVLLLNPFSYAAEQRRAERGDVDVVAKIVENLENLRWLTREYANGLVGQRKLVVVRVTDSLPRHQHHQVDHTVNVAYYPKSHPASSGPYLRAWARSDPGRFAVEAFEDVWEPGERDAFETMSLERFFIEYSAKVEAVRSRIANQAAQGG